MEVQDLLEYVNSELANGSNLTKFAKGCKCQYIFV